MKNWSEDADEQDWSEGTAERTAGGMTPDSYSKRSRQTRFDRIRTDHKWKKSNGVQRDWRKTEDPPGAGATEASSPEKKPVVRSNKTPKPKPTMSSGKLRDSRRDIEHNWQMVDGWCDGTNQRAQNETDYLGTWRKGRLLEEATVKAISRRRPMTAEQSFGLGWAWRRRGEGHPAPGLSPTVGGLIIQ